MTSWRGIQQFCEAHHTPGLGPLGTNLVGFQIDVRDGRVYLQCLGQGLEAATDQGWRLGFTRPADKTWFLTSSKKKTIQLRHLESLWFKTWKTHPEIHGFIQHLHTVWQCMTYSWIGSIWQLNSIRDERWNYSTCKPSKLLTVKGCRKHDIMTCRSIQRFCGAHHTPGLGPLVANHVAIFVGFQIDVRYGRVYLQCLGQGLEAATDQGLVKKWHFTETCPISLIQTLEKQSRNPRLHSASTYRAVQRWNYSTGKPSKLFTVRGFQKHDIITCRSIQRFCGAHHTPGLGALVANIVVLQIDVGDGRVFLQCLGQGLEAATDQGWRLGFMEKQSRKDAELSWHFFCFFPNA